MTAAGPAKTHAMRALIDLRARIISGTIPGGTRLFEVSLAEELGISRTPVREAMSRLVEEGLLERARNGGFLVRSFACADVLDAIELRGVLEGTAARLAAERGADPQALDRIKAILARLDACFGTRPEDVDFDAYSEQNAEYHAVLAGLSGSDMLRREIARVTSLPFASPSAFLPDRNRIGEFRLSLNIAQAQHHALVTAIEAREGARAEALAREHVRAARHNVVQIFNGGKAHPTDVPGLALVVD